MAAQLSAGPDKTSSLPYKCVEQIGNATLCKPPQRPTIASPSVFLAGSIEMGRAIDWQSTVTNGLSHLPVTVLNPRRDDWDSTWVQDISNKQFREQVEWEMDHLNQADVIALLLQPDTLSPISLLELGMHAHEGKMVVCCPPGFWRRGNVQIVCHRYGIPLVETTDELVAKVTEKLEAKIKERQRSG